MMTSETSPSAPPDGAGAGFAGRPFAGRSRGGFRHVEPPRDRIQRLGVANENPQALLRFCRGVIQRLGMQHPRPHVLALQFGAELQQYGSARLQHVAILRKAFGKQHRLEMAGRV